MKRIDFYAKKKLLHMEMLEAIVALFEKTGGIEEIDFIPEGEWQRNVYVILSPDGADSTQEVRVHKVRCIEGEVEVLPYGQDNWVSCEFAGDVVTDTLDDLYDEVYNEVADLNHVYYVCELDEKGIPTGKVTKETWRLEYAEHVKEQRGFIYNDLETARLHAQYKS